MDCGTLRFRKDGVWVYEVDKKRSLIDKIIPFFQKYQFLSLKKQNDFLRFCKLVNIVYKCNISRTYRDVVDILTLLGGANNRCWRKYTDAQILQRAHSYYNKNKDKISILNIKSSETRSQT